MNNYLCLFPFIEISAPHNICGVYLKPGTKSFLDELDSDVKELIRKVQEQLAVSGSIMNTFSFALFAKDKDFVEEIDAIKKVADFLRFRLSYKTEEFD
jgi:hypothetical protein